ncbi:unnamed protein product [Fusarium graminearum]|uniref:Chromosome 1, complete genome n=1 Tax=Gibberella zeae (strain ATCC MYA-4620 / CBS 123657 / FGSC 9075 / NRRL 31084 / PH-1) TaxID=229533 RepID=I1SA15_GIBZE|nr:hypothetical protein FGSG_13696 [Fusarium graminearum PH-1]ESU16729.1 hypothetical protein FGSG_13696 [Fusarium graminearum PH-1]EYB22275.1 hypothetical protein FG05_13696 [Fusarium graminearum]CEF75399.1 unnamed protein product [Fusarium graminearum]CZS78680.1 unnamed protein product [Fusarium graminearum]|eukprot:XP_011318991.1 hypothetical protein FGSG_13696 [Fusarium graminearum PH-1]
MSRLQISRPAVKDKLYSLGIEQERGIWIGALAASKITSMEMDKPCERSKRPVSSDLPPSSESGGPFRDWEWNPPQPGSAFQERSPSMDGRFHPDHGFNSEAKEGPEDEIPIAYMLRHRFGLAIAKLLADVDSSTSSDSLSSTWNHDLF